MSTKTEELRGKQVPAQVRARERTSHEGKYHKTWEEKRFPIMPVHKGAHKRCHECIGRGLVSRPVKRHAEQGVLAGRDYLEVGIECPTC